METAPAALASPLNVRILAENLDHGFEDLGSVGFLTDDQLVALRYDVEKECWRRAIE